MKANKSLDPQKPKAKPVIATNPVTITTTLQISDSNNSSYFDDWSGNEYDPAIPNEYDKIMKERRERDKERRESRKESKRHKFDKETKFEDDEFKPATTNRSLGAMIAPPPSLQDSSNSSTNG